MRVPNTKEFELYGGIIYIIFIALLISLAISIVLIVFFLPGSLIASFFLREPNGLSLFIFSLLFYFGVVIILYRKFKRKRQKKIIPDNLNRKRIKVNNETESAKLLQLNESDKEKKLKQLLLLKENTNRRVKEIISEYTKIPFDKMESSLMIWELKISEPVLRKIVKNVENEFGVQFPINYAQTVNSVGSIIKSVKQKLNYRINILKHSLNKQMNSSD